MSLSVIENIEVSAEVKYLVSESRPESQQYVFSYTMTIVNAGIEPATLMGRHWIITDADGAVQEVRGDGVLGQQPCLQPGDKYQYVSYSILSTPVGSMHGAYQMRLPQGEMAEAKIPAFRLAIPGSLH